MSKEYHFHEATERQADQAMYKRVTEAAIRSAKAKTPQPEKKKPVKAS